MTPDDAFLADIIARPDDDGLRLIYADYLDERNDPRGEFVRAQVELARLPEGDPRQDDLLVRERQLLDQHEQRWLGPLRGRVNGWGFRRGFVERVEMVAEAFPLDAWEVFRHAPVSRLRLRGTSHAVAVAAARHEMARLASLDLRFDDLTDRDAELLARLPHLAGLEGLVMAGNRLTTAGRDTLVDCFGERVSFSGDREPNHLYPLPADEGWVKTGVAGDRRQALLLDDIGEVLVLLFDLAGRLREVQTWPQFDLDTPLPALTEELGFRPATIRVRKFALPDNELGIEDLPSWHADFLAHPDRFTPEEQEHHLDFLKTVWDANDQFVFRWGNDYWVDRRGEVVAS
jgi:uncharacterized protein (TIGR02996 family)